MDYKETFDDALSAAIAATPPLLTGGDPAVAVLSAAMQPFVKILLGNVTDFVSNGFHSRRESNRLHKVYVTAIDKIKENDYCRKIPVNNYLLDPRIGIHALEDLIEQTLKNAVADSERRKTEYYGHFIANLPLYENIDIDTAVFLNDVLHKLSYSQLCALSYLYSKGKVNAEKLRKTQPNCLKAVLFFQDIKTLKDNGLLNVVPFFTVGDIVGNVVINELGKSLYKLMDLDIIPKDDVFCYDSYDIEYTGRPGT